MVVNMTKAEGLWLEKRGVEKIGINKILRELGMGSYKIETYLALLKIGSGTIQQIAKNSSVPACKLYENLKWLYEHGYLSLTLEKPLTYQANDPKIILLGEISRRKEGMERLEKELQKLKLDFPRQEKDVVQVTNSREAFFKKMKESVVNSRSSISYLAKSWAVDAELWRLLKDKNKEEVRIRALGPLGKNISSVKWLAQTGIKMKNYLPGTTRFSVFDKENVIIRLRKDEANYYSIWIKSEVLAEILENYFDLLWKTAKK